MKDIIEAAIEAGATRIFSKNPPDYALMGNGQITKFADIIRRDAIPEGYALVPIEPTELMESIGDMNSSCGAADVYRAMVAAAQEGSE